MKEPNMFTDEQLEILRKGFQEHDFTQTVPLNMSYEDMTPEQAAAFVALKTRIMDSAKANLPALDIKRKVSNFSGDFPVNLLMDADSTYIANEAVNILGDARRTQDAINQFFDMFGGVVDEAILVYCTRKNKTPDELTDADEQRIMERVTQVVNETLLETVMRQTQRELNDAIIDEILCTGTADIAEDDLAIIRTTAEAYVADIFRRLREHDYDEKTMTLHITGGGGCLVRNVYHGDLSRTKFVTDICAAAKGYEYLASIQLKAEAAR